MILYPCSLVLSQEYSMDIQVRIFIFALQIGIVLIPTFSVLDYFTYPEYIYPLITIRVITTIYLLTVLMHFRQINKKYHFLIALSAFLVVSFSVSFMCFITGDGFRSPYYAGMIQIILVSTILVNIKPLDYMIIVFIIIAQHFILLSFLPWEYKDLIKNIMALGLISLAGILIHNHIYKLVEENNRLKGFLPICAGCKKIRDKNGIWHDVETFISDNSRATFSHGICNECRESLYPESTPDNETP